MQIEMMTVMALEVLRDVAASRSSPNVLLSMSDETTDSSNSEQVVICLRWVDNSLNAPVEFTGLQQVDTIDAASITFHNVLQRTNHR